MKWTLEMLQTEALKYSNKYEFRKGNNGAYQASRKRGILPKICTHMGARRNEAYTEEEVENEASKYKTRGEFQKYSQGFYKASIRMKILDKICSHMGKPGNNSIPEQNIIDFVKKCILRL